MKIAVVTGASSGMGREFVIALDKSEQFDEIWAIARRAERLETLRDSVKAVLRPIPMDLTDKNNILALKELLEKEKPMIAVLVNAAGFGKFKAFEKVSLEEQLDIIELNDKALTAVTYLALPYMKEGSVIYNLGSMSSFQPVPYMAVYGASKAFVLSFSRALNVELKSRRIRVMAVCPGWIKTEFFGRAISDDTVTYFNRYYSAEQVVTRALADMKKGKEVSVLGSPERLQVFLVKHLPHSLVMKTWCKQQKKV